MNKGNVFNCSKQEGDKIVKGETLLEVETDKVTNEVVVASNHILF
jgi:pyruvate/2-oxoglutarate dehydrogenase complex dihydrolipoamide acyltransferase (E2) component